jgi:hypothetical protein
MEACMRIKLNLVLSFVMIIAVFFLSSCGGNGEQTTSEKETPQAAPAPTAIADDERKIMYSILFNSLLAVDGYGIDNGFFPAQREDLEDYGITFTPEYDVQYKVIEKDGKVEDFSFTILNPTKAYRLDFDSSCYKDASCLNAWRNSYLNQKLDDSQIKPVTE